MTKAEMILKVSVKLFQFCFEMFRCIVLLSALLFVHLSTLFKYIFLVIYLKCVTNLKISYVIIITLVNVIFVVMLLHKLKHLLVILI